LQKYQKLPDFCALGVINLTEWIGNSLGNRTQISDTSNKVSGLAHFCAACKPGYKSTSLNIIYYYIKIKCEPIVNCIGN